MTCTIRPVRNRGDLKEFIRLPYRKYAGHPFWVPPLRLDQRHILDRRHHPFYLRAEAEFFLAERDGIPCGRIAAIHNHAHNEFHEEKTGFFGFFEVMNQDPETARALLDTAAGWCARRGLNRIRGPVNPSTNYECACLVEGFDKPPVFLMPYNPSCYADWIEAAGFVKAKDLLAYWLSDEKPFPAKLMAIADRVLAKDGITTREVRLERLDEEVERIFSVYNNAWSRNWGFVPMSREELKAMAADLKWVCDPRIIYIAEKGDTPVGFLIGLPDLNRILKQMNGRLLPLGWFRLLRDKRRLGFVRVLAMGFAKEYQNYGFTAAIYRDVIVKGGAAGYHFGEIGWVLEDNTMMNRAAGMLGAYVYKRYRIYEKPL